MNVKELMDRFLEEEGFKYEFEDDTYSLKFQGIKLHCILQENHETLLYIAASYDTEHLPRYVILDLCNELNQTSILKHFLMEEDTAVVAYEAFIDHPNLPNEELMEILEVLSHGASRYCDRMNELTSYLSHPASKTVN